MQFACANKNCQNLNQPIDHDPGMSEAVFKNQSTGKQNQLAPKCPACTKGMKPWKPAFAWNFTLLQTQILNGQYDTQGHDNERPLTGDQTEAIWYYNGKHFNQDNKKNGIGVYLPTLNRIDVRRMEDYAIKYGFGMEGEKFFRFAEEIGYDGVSGQTSSLRVDTGSVQHSHPIPENQGGTVSHDTKVKSTIIFYSFANDHDGIIQVAKYLTVIGQPRGSVSLTLSQQQKEDFRKKGASVPASAFWNSPSTT